MEGTKRIIFPNVPPDKAQELEDVSALLLTCQHPHTFIKKVNERGTITITMDLPILSPADS